MEISRSSVSSKNISVFKDGILIPSISTPPYEVWPISGPRALPIPRLVVNITKGRIGTVNISRTELLDEGEHWAKPIYNAFINYILNKYKDKLLALEPVERAYKLGRISVFHNIDIHRLWHLFPHDRWPLIFLESGGYIKGEDWVNVSKSSISLFPLHNDTGTFLSLSEKPDKWLDEFFSKWIGEQVLVQNIWHKFPNSLAGTCAQHLCDVPLKKYFYLRKICFLEPPWEGNPPMLQRILYPIENTDGNKSIEDILEIAAEEPSKLTAYEVHQLNSYFQREGVFKELLLAEAIEFPHPFSESFAFGGDLMNIKHPGGEALFRFRATLELAKIRKNLPAEQFGKLTDSYMNFNNKKKAISICYDKFTSSMIRLLDLAEELKLIDIGDISTIIPDLKDFIPGTLITYDGHKYYFENNKLSNITNINFFGKVL